MEVACAQILEEMDARESRWFLEVQENSLKETIVVEYRSGLPRERKHVMEMENIGDDENLESGGDRIKREKNGLMEL